MQRELPRATATPHNGIGKQIGENQMKRERESERERAREVASSEREHLGPYTNIVIVGKLQHGLRQRENCLHKDTEINPFPQKINGCH